MLVTQTGIIHQMKSGQPTQETGISYIADKIKLHPKSSAELTFLLWNKEDVQNLQKLIKSIQDKL